LATTLARLVDAIHEIDGLIEDDILDLVAPGGRESMRRGLRTVLQEVALALPGTIC
jgi:hypothetical protein